MYVLYNDDTILLDEYIDRPNLTEKKNNHLSI